MATSPSWTPLSSSSLTDKKEYGLLTLPNGLVALLISDVPHLVAAEAMAAAEGAAGDGQDDDDDADESATSLPSSSHPSRSGEERRGNAGDGDSSDSESTEDAAPQPVSSACMIVDCGSFDEARNESPSGLAHFLEHMLFMGSAKYPKENCYDDYLASQGGTSNAYTDAEQTCYYFDVPQQGLHHALDIFAQFFISPLLLEDALERETEAVNSEFELSRTDDDSRLSEIFAMLAPKSSPYSRFCCGNTSTLRVAGIRDKLLSLHRDFYFASNMKLVVWAIEPMSSLRDLVSSAFANLPRGPGNPRSSLPFNAWQQVLGDRRNILMVVPVQDVHSLRLRWQLPSVKHHYRAQPASYVAHVLGHESKGSLLHALKRKGLATELMAGISYDDGADNSSFASVFNVEIKLTEQGVRHFEAIIAAVFAGVGLLRAEGAKEWLFKEQSAMHELSFLYKDEGEPSEVVCQLASELVAGVPARDLLMAGHLWFDFDQDLIASIIACLGATGDLAPQIVLLSSLLGREKDWAESGRPAGSMAPAGVEPSVEPLYGARFWHVAFSAASQATWERALVSGAAFDASLELALPRPNPYLPTDIVLRPLDTQRAARDLRRAQNPLLEARVEVRQALRKAWLPATVVDADAERVLVRFELGEGQQWCAKADVRVVRPQLPPTPTQLRGCALQLWHLQAVAVPRLAVFLLLKDPAAQGVGRAHANLACAVAAHLLTDELYMAQQAELEVSLKADDSGFNIHVWGFSHHCVALAETVVRTLVKVCRNSAPAEIVAIEREALHRRLTNADANPARFASQCRLRAIVPGTPTSAQLATALSSAPAQPLLGQAVAGALLVHGNASEAEARAACGRLASLLKVTAEDGPPLPSVLVVKPGRRVMVLPAAEPQENNCCVHRYHQLGRDEEEARAMAELLEHVISERLFDELRTKQQVGYAVSCTVRRTHGVLGFSFDVTSSRFAPSAIDAKLDAFLQGVQQWLENELEDQDVRDFAATLAQRLLKPEAALVDETRSHWQVVEDRTFAFHDRHALAFWLTQGCAKAKGPSVKALRAFYRKFFGAQHASVLSVWVVGQACGVATVDSEKAKVTRAKNLVETPEQLHTGAEKWRL